MSITYQDMRKKALHIQAQKNKRVYFVKSSVEKLISEYITSLNLENETWLNLEGEAHSYVRVADVTDNSQPISIAEINTHIVTFQIFTVVNDELRGGDEATCSVTIASDKQAEYLTVTINNNPSLKFNVIDWDFNAVCSAIKDATYANISKLENFE